MQFIERSSVRWIEKGIRELRICDEVYEWRNNYAIQELFDTAFPDEWCEYKKKYRSLNCGYYPIVGLLSNMQKVDSDFAKKYHEGIDNIFYKGYWWDEKETKVCWRHIWHHI